MDEVTGPILSITSVLAAAVFILPHSWRAAGSVLSSVRVDHRYFDHPFDRETALTLSLRWPPFC